MNTNNLQTALVAAVASMVAAQTGKTDARTNGATLIDNVRQAAVIAASEGKDAANVAKYFAGIAASQSVKASTIGTYQNALEGYILLSAGLVDMGQGEDSEGNLIPVNIMVGGSATGDKPRPKEYAIEARKAFVMTSEEKEAAREKAALNDLISGYVKALKACASEAAVMAWLDNPTAHEDTVKTVTPEKMTKAERDLIALKEAGEAAERELFGNDTGNAQIAVNS